MKGGISVTVLVFVVAVIGTCTCQCPDCWMQYKGSCYLFSDKELRFIDAERFCRRNQATLVRIDNPDEDQFLKSHSALFKDATRWMGLTDIANEGIWKYTDGSKPKYIDWSPGEPNNVIRKSNRNGEDCAVLYVKIGYGWNDGNCRSLHKPICEKPVEPCY